MTRQPPKGSRTFADAMRDSAEGSDEGMVWSGGILERKPSGWTGSIRSKLGRFSGGSDDDDAKPASGPALTRHLVRKMAEDNESPGGCFTCASVLFIITIFGWLFLGFDIFDTARESLYLSGGDYWWRLLIVIGLPLTLLLLYITSVLAAGWYRKRYEQRLENAIEYIDPRPLAVPGADHLADLYYGPASGIRAVIFSNRPKDQEQWTEFVAGNLDLYLQHLGLHRIGPGGWLARTFLPWAAVVAAAAMLLPELYAWALGFTGLSPQLQTELQQEMPTMLYLFAWWLATGVPDALRDTRKLVFARFMYRHLMADEQPEPVYGENGD